ncbi:MAG: hypothetical protein HY263_09650 [Chloroflexi bacterium]|nr:hypothetical protein [Chloroflexota bacterium]
MPIVAIASLSILIGVSLFLWLFGQRFSRRYRETRGVMPPMTWMFRPTGDRELERWRRPALAILPIYLIALVLYLSRP